MKLARARRTFLLLHDDGTIHFPFTKYLNGTLSNPNTQELVSQSLRVFNRFLSANSIEPVVRALEGRCLTHNEFEQLVALCYRPLAEVESLTDRKVVSIASAKAGKAPESMPNAVEINTAAKRLQHIAQYLHYFLDIFLLPSLRSQTLREELRREYEKVEGWLTNKIRGTKQGHHHDIQSLPSDKFLKVIQAIFVRPEELFVTASGSPSRTQLRDRAMSLLACEGLRPGTLGNLSVADFRQNSRHMVIQDHRDLRKRVTSSTPLLKLGLSTLVNNASETMITLWPLTVEAIREYIYVERQFILGKRLRNKSDGFLFINEKGEPLQHRSSITAMFHRLGQRLQRLHLLDVGDDPYFRDQKTYNFYAYVLRHSSASLFMEHKATDVQAQSEMKSRFGWTAESKQPQRYAARALSDKANVDLMEFNQQLLDEVKAKKLPNTGRSNAV